MVEGVDEVQAYQNDANTANDLEHVEGHLMRESPRNSTNRARGQGTIDSLPPKTLQSHGLPVLLRPFRGHPVSLGLSA